MPGGVVIFLSRFCNNIQLLAGGRFHPPNLCILPVGSHFSLNFTTNKRKTSQSTHTVKKGRIRVSKIAKRVDIHDLIWYNQSIQAQARDAYWRG